MGLLAFHFGTADAPGESKADVAAGEGTFACGRVIRVNAFAACADGAEKVVDVEEERESAVEEVGACSAVEREVGVDGGEEGLSAAAVGGVGEELQFVPQFCPKVEPQRVTEHFAFLPVSGTILHKVVVIKEIGVETDVHEVGWAQGGVESDAGVAGGANIERL